jgi:hypothetical protein
MNLRQTEAWQRHQLATTERMQADIGRFTRPVMITMCVSSLAYLMSWGPLMSLGNADNMPWLPLLIAGLSACIMAVTTPAFTLAVAIESYFRRRLHRENFTAKQGVIVRLKTFTGRTSDGRSAQL